MNPNLSIKTKTGQMIMAGFTGTALSAATEDLIQNRGVGGFILFERNFENPLQLFRLIRDLQTLALSCPPGLPLFISVDQEGGRVARLKAPFTEFPLPCCLGNARSEELAYRFGTALAQELKAVGINMNHAPVLDVNSNPQNPIIGNRALSDNPQWVARLSASIIRAFKESGIIPVGKHFPGHGDTAQDSHLELPTVDRQAASLEATELPPFANAISVGLEVIMTAHVTYPAWDEKYPATFSPTILQNILRQRLGFQGLVVSDDLEMKAIENHFPFESLPELGTRAGIDQFLICNDTEKVKALQDRMVQDIETGRIEVATIDRSLERICNVKSGLTAPPSNEPDLESLAADHQNLVREMKAFL